MSVFTTSINEDCPGSFPQTKTCGQARPKTHHQSLFCFNVIEISTGFEDIKRLANAVPASAASAERKLKKSAFVTVKPDLTRIPKSPICKYLINCYYLLPCTQVCFSKQSKDLLGKLVREQEYSS